MARTCFRVFPRSAFAFQLSKLLSSVPGATSPSCSFRTIFFIRLRCRLSRFPLIRMMIFPVSVTRNRHCRNFTPCRSG